MSVIIIAIVSMLFLYSLIAFLVALIVFIIQLARGKKTKSWIVMTASSVLSTVCIVLFIAMPSSPKKTDDQEATETEPSAQSIEVVPTPVETEVQKALSDYDVLSAEILGDSGEAIGVRAYIDMEWEVFSNAGDKEKYDFLETVFDKGFEYLNVFFDNGYVLWAWGSPAVFQIGDMPSQGFGAVKYITGDGIRGRYVWRETAKVYSYS